MIEEKPTEITEINLSLLKTLLEHPVIQSLVKPDKKSLTAGMVQKPVRQELRLVTLDVILEKPAEESGENEVKLFSLIFLVTDLRCNSN